MAEELVKVGTSSLSLSLSLSPSTRTPPTKPCGALYGMDFLKKPVRA
jgi:hypothetical protein